MTDHPSTTAKLQRLHVIQGEHAVSSDPTVFMTTVLGSCVSACLHDPERRVGGMNHFLLAEGAEAAMRYGAYAMEVLINDLMKRGARRDRLEAKLFGGAKMVESLGDVGAANAEFARRFLAEENIPVIAASLGGRSARRVEFWPTSGRARQREAEPATHVREKLPPVVEGGDVEFF